MNHKWTSKLLREHWDDEVGEFFRLDEDGTRCYFGSDPDDFLLMKEFKFCGCGLLEEVAKAMLTTMEKMERREHIGEDPAALIVAYFLNVHGLAEHGFSIFSSWPTDTGKEFLEALREAVAWREEREK